MKLKVTGRELTFSKDVIALSPELGLGGLEPAKPQQNPARPLDHGVPTRESREIRLVISLTRFGRRKLDDDNLAGAFKPLRDACSKDLGANDADPRIRWEYGQIETRGRCGVMVRIEELR